MILGDMIMEKFKPNKYPYHNLSGGETIFGMIIFLPITYIFNILHILKILMIIS